jgi:hypothetical protein
MQTPDQASACNALTGNRKIARIRAFAKAVAGGWKRRCGKVRGLLSVRVAAIRTQPFAVLFLAIPVPDAKDFARRTVFSGVAGRP